MVQTPEFSSERLRLLNTKPEYQRAVLPANNNLLNFIALLFQLLPKNLISLTIGWLVRLRLPRPLALFTVKAFALAFRIDMEEAEWPLEHYLTIEDLFIRKLKPFKRPLEGNLVSPADGFLAISAPCEPNGGAIQAKGFTYSLDELVFGSALVEQSVRVASTYTWYQTTYLAPHNYHRVHAPFAGLLTQIRYVPGQLWPVNLPFVLRIPNLFCRNERLVFDFELPSGGKAWVVMVGALNVGRMVTPHHPDLVTNALARQFDPRPSIAAINKELPAGAELGTFMLGSTVIVVYDRQALEGLGGPEILTKEHNNRPIKMGQTLLRGTHD